MSTGLVIWVVSTHSPGSSRFSDSGFLHLCNLQLKLGSPDCQCSLPQKCFPFYWQLLKHHHNDLRLRPKSSQQFTAHFLYRTVQLTIVLIMWISANVVHFTTVNRHKLAHIITFGFAMMVSLLLRRLTYFWVGTMNRVFTQFYSPQKKIAYS